MSDLFSFDKLQLERLFPFYIQIDRDLKIVSIGKSLAKVIPIKKDSIFNDSFAIPRPLTSINSFENLVDLTHQLIVLKSFSDKDLVLRGQFEYLEQNDQILFVGSPWFNSMEQVRENNLVINDFANHDPLVDLLHVLKSVELTNDDLKELITTSDKQKTELKEINREVRDIALFTEQNPDPLLRIDFDGELLKNNPAASKLDFIEFKGEIYRNDEFFKMIVSDIKKEFKRWSIECASNNIDYSFNCVSLPEEGYVNFYGTDISRQKKDQLELKKLSLIVQQTINAVIITGIEGKIEWINDGFEKMTGYSLAEALGKTPGRLLQGADSNPETVDFMRSKIANSEPFTCEILNYKKTGEAYWLRINAQPIFDLKGKAVQYFAIEEDITLEKQIQAKLENQRVFYEQILDNIPADIAVFDKTHKYLYVNPKGISDVKLRNWMIGKRDEDYIRLRNKPMSLLKERREKFNQVLASKQLKSWEEKMKQPGDSDKFILRNLYPVVNNKEDVELIIGYGVDITEIKEIQERIIESEKRYRDVIDNSLAIVTTHDLEGKFLTVNPMVYKLYGYSDKEVIGRNLTDFMPEEDKSLFHEEYLYKIKTEKEATGIFRVIHKNGSMVYSLFNNFLKEELGEEPYVIGFAVDITVRIMAEKELKRAKKITEELAESKQNFLANMSHEIRTPMNAIMGMSRQLQKTELSEMQQLYADTITNSSDNLLVIINDVLDLSKLDAGKLIIEKIGFEPKNIVSQVIQLLMHKAEEKGLLISNSFCDSRLNDVLLGDPYRITQILLNLISNAIKFTAQGVVDLSCYVLEETEDHQLVEIKVSDTGIGMDATFVKSLFEKFSQEDESITRRFGGTGLGMSITKSLMDLMEGEILVESEKGKGTIVHLKMKFQKGTSEDLIKKITEEVKTNDLRGKKILVVDDNETNRLVASIILNDFGVFVTEVEDGAEAVKMVGMRNFDLILMDIQMPVLNGYEATKIIRKELKSRIPIIALTANAIKGESDKCLNAGMNGYLSKPFEEEQLLQIVSQWLDTSNNLEQEFKDTIQTPLFDLTKLRAIAKGNDAFVDKMLGLFISQVPVSVSDMEVAYKTNDYKKVKAIAHKIKPSIETLGISALKEEIKEIEKNAEIYGTSEQMERLIAKLDGVIKEVIKDLKKHVK